MSRRRKHPRLPNKFGSVRYLGAGRNNPYAVHPPAVGMNDKGNYIRPPALCYVDDWYVGFAVLNAWHAGTYKPGDEFTFKQYRVDSSIDGLDLLTRRITHDFAIHIKAQQSSECGETFEEVYKEFYEWKFGANARREYSKSSRDSTRAAFENCKCLHKRTFNTLKHRDLQECVDGCTLHSASIENMVTLIKQMYKYAVIFELVEKNPAEHLTAPPCDDKHGVAFTDDELNVLWKNKNDSTVEMILIMCYSGYRIAAYKTMEINVNQLYFKGGVKTAAGKGRTVPVHSAIQPLVIKRLRRLGELMSESPDIFRKKMYAALDKLGIERHTPHDCRHTFSRLCEKFHVNEADRKRMLGHSFGADITNGIYGHRTLEELREEIEKIKIL